MFGNAYKQFYKPKDKEFLLSQGRLILDGKLTSQIIKQRISLATKKLAEQNITPKLDIILVGNNLASTTYINNKIKSCQQVGINSTLHHLPEDSSLEQVIEQINLCNTDKNVSGIILQLPLPQHLKKYEDLIISAINKDKDADCFLAQNIAEIFLGINKLIPCTAQAVVQLLDYYQLDVKGKHVVIVGTSNIVGKPLALELINRQATVTTCNIFTKDLANITQQADILVSATGVAYLIQSRHVKQGAIVLDVGANFIDNPEFDEVLEQKFAFLSNITEDPKQINLAKKKLTLALIETDARFAGLDYKQAKKLVSKLTNPSLYVGDVKAQDIMDKVSAISLVPGGVGQNTVSNLLQNTLVLCLKQNNLELADYGLEDVKGFNINQALLDRYSSEYDNELNK